MWGYVQVQRDTSQPTTTYVASLWPCCAILVLPQVVLTSSQQRLHNEFKSAARFKPSPSPSDIFLLQLRAYLSFFCIHWPRLWWAVQVVPSDTTWLHPTTNRSPPTKRFSVFFNEVISFADHAVLSRQWHPQWQPSPAMWCCCEAWRFASTAAAESIQQCQAQ